MSISKQWTNECPWDIYAYIVDRRKSSEWHNNESKVMELHKIDNWPDDLERQLTDLHFRFHSKKMSNMENSLDKSSYRSNKANAKDIIVEAKQTACKESASQPCVPNNHPCSNKKRQAVYYIKKP